jgi:DNA-binding PadR family transcriptional regulator
MKLQDKLNAWLPLTETVFLILLSLSNEDRHGYAIMKDVEALSDGRVQFSTGTLYGALRRLLEDDWIEREDGLDKGSEADRRKRKYYSLTQTGRQLLELELRRMQKLSETAIIRTSEAEA